MRVKKNLPFPAGSSWQFQQKKLRPHSSFRRIIDLHFFLSICLFFIHLTMCVWGVGQRGAGFSPFLVKYSKGFKASYSFICLVRQGKMYLLWEINERIKIFLYICFTWIALIQNQLYSPCFKHGWVFFISINALLIIKLKYYVHKQL